MSAFRVWRRNWKSVLPYVSTVSVVLILGLGAVLFLLNGRSEGSPRNRFEPARESPSCGTPDLKVYCGMSAASAAVPLDSNRFVVGNDEDNILRIYSTCESGVIDEIKLSALFRPDVSDTGGKSKIDIEGAARLGDLIFWVGSHSQTNDGEDRLGRRRLLAHDVRSSGAAFSFTAIGKPYEGLFDEIAKDPRFSKYNLIEASKRPAKAEGALNIEGLSSAPDNKSLFIGFRNPLSKNLALVVHLLNPVEVFRQKAAARLGDPIELDLGGFGIRDMAWWDEGKTCFIIAGPFGSNDKKETFRLYRWTGERGDKPREIMAGGLQGINAEAIVIHTSEEAGKCRLQILSDDEDLVEPKCVPAGGFRSVWVDVSNRP